MTEQLKDQLNGQLDGPLTDQPSGPPSGPPGAQRFALLPTGRHLLPVAVATGAAVGLLGAGAVRAVFLAAALLLGLLHLALQRRRPVLIVDAEGYRVERGGRERLRVAWSEARRVLLDREERALYVDCGDAARNLLVPPRRGFAFTFADRDRLVDAVLAALPDRIEEVPDLARASLSPGAPGAPGAAAAPGPGPGEKSS